MDDAGQAKTESSTLKQALREARIEAAERSAVIVDLRDAEAARLEILNEALAPLFEQIPFEHVELFDRNVSGGASPRLWVDTVTHVAMGRDKRTYRLLNDTAYGRRVLAESLEIPPMGAAITRYVARRRIAREQALMAGPERLLPQQKSRVSAVFLGIVVGILVGAGGLIALAYWLTS